MTCFCWWKFLYYDIECSAKILRPRQIPAGFWFRHGFLPYFEQSPILTFVKIRCFPREKVLSVSEICSSSNRTAQRSSCCPVFFISCPENDLPLKYRNYVILPLRTNIQSRRTPYVNYALIAVNILIFPFHLDIPRTHQSPRAAPPLGRHVYAHPAASVPMAIHHLRLPARRTSCILSAICFSSIFSATTSTMN